MATAVEIVESFLNAMGRRDFAALEALMAPDFKMTVSGGHVFRHPREFAAQSRGRQRSAKKTTDRYEEIPHDKGSVVYAMGSMAGEWNDGTTYANVRYIDRFDVQNGKIVDMNVWSDMAEFRPKG
ncbi:MAG: nuclear transport factor 2 family protein [Rhodospirillaceae bacterium]|nr:nuclear transport factor 2 family protein [Rhodospirillaceae bacterium]